MALPRNTEVDRYRSFEELSRYESEFEVEVRDHCSDVSIIAPHGGRIEPNTSEIAALIAADRFNLFCFRGSKQDDNRSLHITSHRFDHPRALNLISSSRYVVAVHGCTIRRPVVYLGGLDTVLIRLIRDHLTTHQIDSHWGNDRFKGTHPYNICNRGKSKRGVQLELSRGVRDNRSAQIKVALAVQSAISVLEETGRGKGVTSPINARKSG